MAEVLPFRRPEPPDHHLSGEALCLGCHHTWVAVAPVGVWQLDCPACGAPKGIFRLPVGAAAGDLEFACETCGGVALTAYKSRGKFWLRCMTCGEDKTEAIFG